ncbi:hypothetical protein JW930_04290 [Candidatus Woesearchaeota archaeon]|nr:hypothetical protein [Candidatus Woesearchaeota archaeon]
MLTCSKCKNEYPSSEIKFSMTNAKLLCVYCLGEKTRKIEIPFEAEENQQEEVQEVLRYHCKACQYNFSKRKSAEVNRCPYCSREGTVELRKSANELLIEALEPLYAE